MKDKSKAERAFSFSPADLTSHLCINQISFPLFPCLYILMYTVQAYAELHLKQICDTQNSGTILTMHEFAVVIYVYIILPVPFLK